MRTRHLLLLLNLMLTTACADNVNKTGCQLSFVLPTDEAVGEFMRTETYAEANNEIDLYNLIDGGAPKYLENGFVCMQMAEYTSRTQLVSITIWLYDQGTKSGAKDAYAATYTSQQDLTPTIGDASRENTSLPFNYAVDMRMDRFLVHITTDVKEAKESALEMLNAIAEAL